MCQFVRINPYSIKHNLIKFLMFLLIAICTSQFRNEFEQLFGEILWRSRCSVIRTSILEVALALSFAGLPLNGFNFDKVCGGLLATSVEANKLSDTATTTTASEASIAIWRPLEAKVQSQLQLLLSTSDDVIDDLNGKLSFSSQWATFHHFFSNAV